MARFVVRLCLCPFLVLVYALSMHLYVICYSSRRANEDSLSFVFALVFVLLFMFVCVYC
jgi:hypothetical protein